MEVHRGGDGNVGDGRVVIAQPLAAGQRILQDLRLGMKCRRVIGEQRLVRHIVQHYFDDVLDQILIAGAEPFAGFP